MTTAGRSSLKALPHPQALSRAAISMTTVWTWQRQECQPWTYWEANGLFSVTSDPATQAGLGLELEQGESRGGRGLGVYVPTGPREQSLPLGMR